jgi:hypothetical protein
VSSGLSFGCSIETEIFINSNCVFCDAIQGFTHATILVFLPICVLYSKIITWVTPTLNCSNKDSQRGWNIKIQRAQSFET